MSIARVAANPQALRPRLHAREKRRGALTDPAIFVAEDALDLVPAVEQARGVAGEAEVDDVFAIARVQLGAVGGRQKIVDAAVVGGAVVAARAFERVEKTEAQRAVAIGTAKLGLEAVRIETDRRGIARFAAHRGERATEPARRAPISSGDALGDPLAPAALAHEDLVLSGGEMFVNQALPLLNAHAVVL